MSVSPKLICRFNPFPIKSPAGFFFVEIGKLILKFIWKCRLPRIATFLKKNKVEGLKLLDFKTYYKANSHEYIVALYTRLSIHIDQ